VAILVPAAGIMQCTSTPCCIYCNSICSMVPGDPLHHLLATVTDTAKPCQALTLLAMLATGQVTSLVFCLKPHTQSTIYLIWATIQ
jgi:hypothetical protein